jgi:hypothetical protein
MVGASLYMKSARSLRAVVAVGLLLGLSRYSYYVWELLVCWLLFSLAFALLALVFLGGVLACYAGKVVIHWASTVARVTPAISLGPAELHLKAISGGGKLK